MFISASMTLTHFEVTGELKEENESYYFAVFNAIDRSFCLQSRKRLAKVFDRPDLMCVCPSQAIPRKLLDIMVKLGTVTALVMRMHHILTLTFKVTQVEIMKETHVYVRNYSAVPIKFAGKIVRLNAYITIASPMTLTFIQGRKCISNLTTF